MDNTSENNPDREFDLVTRSQEQLSRQLVQDHRSRMPEFDDDHAERYYALEEAIRAEATCGTFPPLTHWWSLLSIMACMPCRSPLCPSCVQPWAKPVGPYWNGFGIVLIGQVVSSCRFCSP